MQTGIVSGNVEASGGFDGLLSTRGSECHKQGFGGEGVNRYLAASTTRPRRKREVIAENYAMAIAKAALELDVHRESVVILEVEKIL